jgi:ABC-type multidrug transport system ATPase subunit
LIGRLGDASDRAGNFQSDALVCSTYAVYGQQQGCPPGLFGPGCSPCTLDAECVVETGSELATCNTGFLYDGLSTVKGYRCNPTGPSLVNSLLKPDSVVVQCHTGASQGAGAVGGFEGDGTAAAQPPASSGDGLFGRRLHQSASSSEQYCDISFTVQSPQVTVECAATSCLMGAGQANVVCAKVSCGCSDGTCNDDLLIQNLVASADQGVTWECDSAGVVPETGRTQCTLGIEGFAVPRIETSCVTGECLVPAEIAQLEASTVEIQTADAKPVNNLSWNWVLAAIPTFVLTGVIGVVGFFSYQLKAYWVSGFCMAATDSKESRGSTVESFEFKNLCVYVRMAEQVAVQKRHALLGKALTRHDTMHVYAMNRKPNVGESVVKRAKKRLGVKTSDDVELPPEFVQKVTRPSKAMDAASQVVRLHDGRKEGEWCVLKGCNGTFAAGELIGILGPSGCGKTTLLGSITGSAMDLGQSTSLSGDILINGRPRVAHQVAYVPQADHLIPTLTVRECVKYSALLRLPRDMSPDEINDRVESVLRELGISHIGDSQVGGSGKIRGVSGGERRRVTIAMELVTDPSIIVLDEPTSGLDSFTALSLLKVLGQVAKGGGGRVVIASLHQPSKDMFFGLDKVILMGHGRMLYQGKPEAASQYMADAGCPGNRSTPTAEHMLEVASNAESIVKMLRAKELADSAAGKNVSIGSPEKPRVPQKGLDGEAVDAKLCSMEADGKSVLMDDCGSEVSPVTDASLSSTGASMNEPKHSLRRELSVMFWRTLVDIVRNPTLLFLHVVLALCTGVVTGAIFYELDFTSIGVQNRMGGTFFALSFLAFTSLTTVDLLMNERTVVLREVRSRFYRPSSYLISKIALDGMLLRVIPAILYWVPFYYMAGFQYGSYYASSYLFTLIAFNCAVGAMSMCVTIGCNTAGQASFIMNFLLLFSLAFTGFLVNVNSIPAVLRWIHYLSVFFYAFEAMLSTELMGVPFTFLYTPSPGQDPLEIPDIYGDTFLVTYV